MSFGPTMPPGSVFAAPSDPSVFRPRDASGWKPGMAMATAVHLLLVAALAMGVQWKIQPPAAVEAEVWTEVPRIDVPQPVAPVPPAPPEVTPPQPAPPPEPVAAEVPVEPKMDVAMIPVKPKVDKHKLSKAEKKQAKKQPKEEFIPDPPKKVPPKTPAKAEKVVAPPPKPVVDPKVAAKAAAKAEAEAQAKSKAEAESLAAQRRANLDKLMKTLAQDQISAAGPSESYIGRIVSRVKSNIVFPRDGDWWATPRPWSRWSVRQTARSRSRP